MLWGKRTQGLRANLRVPLASLHIQLAAIARDTHNSFSAIPTQQHLFSNPSIMTISQSDNEFF